MARSNDSALSLPEFDLQLLERSFDDVQSEAGTEVAAANCWNPLPNEVKNAESLASFRHQGPVSCSLLKGNRNNKCNQRLKSII